MLGPDAAEAALGPNPLLGDTDLDGISDGAEVEFGSKPLGPEPARVGAGPAGTSPGGFDTD